jgi:uncharacterized protein
MHANEFILKLVTRCNLACDYCYVYNLADESWRSKPKAMAPAIQAAAMQRIREHVMAHQIPSVLISLHGGEPLLLGRQFVADAADRIRHGLADIADVHISMQTNATLVDRPTAALCKERGIALGVSLDGPPDDHDRSRKDPAGRPTSSEVLAGIERLQEFPGLLSGILSVIDLESHPESVYWYLADLAPPSIDFLLPHGNWASRPFGKRDALLEQDNTSPHPPHQHDSAPYGEWLKRIFDAWVSDTRQPRVRIRLFDDIIHLLLGGTAVFESLGLDPKTLLVIEAEGSYELVDHLKAAYDGAPQTGLSVLVHSVDEALAHPGSLIRQMGKDALGPECQRCDLLNICGGGLITHRYSDGPRGYAAPSIYCADLYALINHIRVWLTGQLEAVPHRAN